MKAKLKGQSGIKGLLLMHGEKLGMAAVLVVALVVIYSALGVEGLSSDKQHTNLLTQVDRTKTTVEEFTWERAKDAQPDSIREALPTVENPPAMLVDAGDYRDSERGGLNSAVLRRMSPRRDPALLAAEAPLAYGGSGLFVFLSEQRRLEAERARLAEEERSRAEAARAADADRREAERGARGGRGDGTGRGAPSRGPSGRAATTRGGREVDFGDRGGGDAPRPNMRRPDVQVPPAGVPITGEELVQFASWAIVVAKVPIKAQRGEYSAAFENTAAGFDPNADFPRYVGYQVQRAEVRRGMEDQLNWEFIDVYDPQLRGSGRSASRKSLGKVVSMKVLESLYESAANEWASGGPMDEVVDERYLDFERILAYPLPPLALRDWSADVTHPEIPLAINAPPEEYEVEPGVAQPAATRAEDVADDQFGARQMLGPSMGLQRGGPRMGAGMRGEYGRMRGDGGYGMSRGSGRAAIGRGDMPLGRTGDAPNLRGASHWLLRFFDFSVEPGKKYKYQVRLALLDPNQAPHVDRAKLEPAVNERIKKAGGSLTLLTNWSAPTPTVGIPLAGNVRVDAVKPTASQLLSDDPKVSLLVESFDVDAKNNAVHAAKLKEFRRGGVANSDDRGVETLVEGGQWIEELDSFRFRTGITMLDMRGGERLRGDMQVPGRVLLMDPAGELYIRRELDDQSAVQLHKDVFTRRRPSSNSPDAGFGTPRRGGS
jgi:hypothetical protein